MYFDTIILNLVSIEKGPITMGAFNKYVDKMRGEGVKKSVFVHAQGIKTVVTWGSKMAKF